MKYFLACLMIVFSLNVSSQEYWDVIGTGTKPCASFLTANTNEKFLYLSWTQGFVTSLLLATEKQKDSRVLNVKYMDYSLQQYCSVNPNKHFFQAAVDYYKTINGEKI